MKTAYRRQRQMCIRDSHWGYEGEEELKSLTSIRVRKLLDEKKIQLISYQDLQRS